MSINKGIPGIPLGALDAIPDENTRLVLQAIVDGWHVRNGATGKGDNRFVTLSEMEGVRGYLGGLVSGINGAGTGGSKTGILTSGEINRIITDLQAQIMESQLWKDLGDRITLIDLNIIKEQLARVAAVQKVADDLVGVANNLAAEAASRLGFDNVIGSKVGHLESATETQATLLSGLTTRVGGAESTIINLQTTTASQALSLSTLTTKVSGAESNIVNLQTTTASQANSLTALTTRVGTAESKVTSLETTSAAQAQTLSSLSTRVSGAESSIGDLRTTTATQANWLTILDTRVGGTEAAITEERTTRANADNAITTSVTTQMSQVNSNIAALQTKDTTISNNVASLASTITTLQAQIGTNTVALQTEAEVRASVDGDIRAKYSVKIDNNGYVTGFGLISTANNSIPYSEFIVRADRFAIGSQSGPGITPEIPFIVLTSTDAKGNPPGVYIDSVMIKNAAIGTAQIDDLAVNTAKIDDLSVNTLKIGGEAVMIPRFASGVWGGTISSSYSADIASITFSISDLPYGATARIVLNATMQCYSDNNDTTNLLLGLFVNGYLNSEIASTFGGEGISMAGIGSFLAGVGTFTVSMRAACTSTPGGAASKSGCTFVGNLVMMAAKR